MAVPNDFYIEVLQFYAEQMQALDSRDFAFYARTFTEDGEFSHSPNLPPSRGPQDIQRTLEDFHRDRFGDEPVQRRHWFNHLVLEPMDDGAFRATCYALVVTTRPGSPPEITPSCVVNDVLVRRDGALRMRSRSVDHDGVLAAPVTTEPVGNVR
ncbi:nuclear transport factor 2 family protein [Nocardiopsis halotolerans]|uniref:nuclear transport factor 2 family protein n=1 Tax=Nocardiopsis halotolerans TaxID=124252 RepID=UPI00034AA008|nr:nuclear transport factor 2 family protein [Nocardiopsis halotolerans]